MIISKRNLKRLIGKSRYEPSYALAALPKKINSLFSYYFFNGYSAYPETISLFLTYNCNLRCKMCGFWGKCGSMRQKGAEFIKEELSLSELKKVIDEVSSFRPNITLFGGEPLLYEDWLDLIIYIKKRDLRCNIVSNGTLFKDRAEEVINSRLDELIFSLEGPREIHDEITEVDGSFDKAITGLKQINEEKKRRSIKKPNINIACTISEDNYRFLEQIIDIGSSIGADSVTFHHLCFINREILREHNQIFKKYFGIQSYDWSGFVLENLPKIDVEYLVRAINKIEKSKYPIGIFFYPNFKEREIIRYYTDFKFSSTSYGNQCLSPWMTVYIFPDGGVRPCEELDFSCGNIRENSFKEIWNNQTFRDFRKVLKKLKLFPVCAKCTELYRF